MRSVALLALVVAGSTSQQVAAEPQKPFCLGKDSRSLETSGGRAIVCSFDTCAAFAVGDPTPQTSKHGERWLPPEITEMSDELCSSEGHCWPLGKHLRAAQARYTRKWQQPAIARTTDDQRALAFDGKVWDTVKDTGVALKSPVKGLTPVAYDAVGTAFVIGWAKRGATDGCQTAIVVDAHGKNRGTAFPGGNLAPLDGGRLVVAPACGRTLSVVDIATGNVTGTVELPDGAEGALVAKVDATTAALLWQREGGEPQLAWVHLGDKPALAPPVTVPACRAP